MILVIVFDFTVSTSPSGGNLVDGLPPVASSTHEHGFVGSMGRHFHDVGRVREFRHVQCDNVASAGSVCFSTSPIPRRQWLTVCRGPEVGDFQAADAFQTRKIAC